ncbi:hypothetical protein IAU60_003473 [Kwoniella sp. DSM 27419]
MTAQVNNTPGFVGSVPAERYPFFARPLKTPSRQEDELIKQLKEVVLEHFAAASAIFNGSVKTHALALVRPTNAHDVSRTVIFCRENGLELSVKGGGHGVHGWSVAGHVILDLCLMNDVSVALPHPSPPSLQSSFEKLKVRRNSSESVEDPATSNGRPSLADIRMSSSDNGAKRGSDALGEDTVIDGSSVDGARRKGKVDSPMDRLVPERSRSSSTAEGSNQGGYSWGGSGSASGSGEDGFVSTPPTSADDRSPPSQSPMQKSMSFQAEAGPSRGPRVTYVNPSQTPASSFPYVGSTFGSGPGMTSAGGFHSAFSGPSQQQLHLNTHPDPPPYTIVSFGAGTHAKQLAAETGASEYGSFQVPMSAFPVGSGQFLSGGFGYLSRKHGMAVDNIVEVEIVLADGRIVWVGENGASGGDWKEGEDPKEIWWAIKGAGAILGVVTRFRAKAFYTPSVYAGNLIYLFDRETAPALLRHVRDCIKGSPRTLYTNIIMTAGPPGAPAILVFQLCFSGSRAEGEMYVQAISAWEGGRSLFQDFSERKFEKQQMAIEELLRGGHGRKWYIKSDMLTTFSDEVIDQTCERFHSVPKGCTWLFEYTGGAAIADVKDSCYPASHRESAFTVAALHQWSHDEAPVEDIRCIATAEDWINEVIHPNSPGGPLPCFVQSSKESAVSAVYGVSYPRLRAVKQLLDPDNFFRWAMWPKKEDEDGPAKIRDAEGHVDVSRPYPEGKGKGVDAGDGAGSSTDLVEGDMDGMTRGGNLGQAEEVMGPRAFHGDA